MKASVVIPTKNRGKALIDTLNSVLDQTFPANDYEVIVVDSSTDDTPQLVQEYLAQRSGPPEVRLLREERVGVHYARHAGARAMRGEIYVQIEDDAVAEPTWLTRLLSVFEDPAIVCAGGKVLPRFETKPPGWMKPYYGWLTVWDLGEERREAYVTACNMAVRREALFEVGGFNPDIIGSELVGNGEVGLVEKLRRASLGEIIYVPDVLVWHCVPACRLTLEYMRWRLYNEGTSTVQTFYQREHPECLVTGVRTVKRTVWAAVDKMFALLHQSRRDALYYHHELRALKWWREARAYWQLIYDREYREFMGREDWIHE